MSMNPIIFSHGNSFPASTYTQIFKSLRSRKFKVKAIEKYGHDPRYPVSNNWPHLVQHLIDFANTSLKKSKEPAWLVGHSLGGFLSLMAAAKQPDLVQGVVLLDSPIVGGWRSKALGMMKTTRIMKAVSPGAVSRKRRNSWGSIDDAFTHFRAKKTFAAWDEQVLRDYVTYGTLDDDGRRILAFDRDIETHLYNTLPDNLDALLGRHPVRCPVTFIGGRSSKEMQQVGLTMTQKITQGRIMMLDGSHLFPMEKPITTAAAIEVALREMMQR
jgi:pimeloyl-ACP methyl ester carboxylesterase